MFFHNFSIPLEVQLLFIFRPRVRKVRAQNLYIARLNSKILFNETKAIPFFFLSQTHCPRTVICNSSTMILGLLILHISLIEANDQHLS